MSAKTSAKPSQKVTFFLAAMWDIYLPRPLPLASDAARLCGFKKKPPRPNPGGCRRRAYLKLVPQILIGNLVVKLNFVGLYRRAECFGAAFR